MATRLSLRSRHVATPRSARGPQADAGWPAFVQVHGPCWRACWRSVRRRTTLQPAVRQVLLLQSFDRGNLSIDYFTGNFRVELDQLAGSPVNVVQVVVGPSGSVGAPEQAVVDYIRGHVRRSSQAGPHRDGRRSCGGVRAPVSTSTLSRHAAPVRGRRSAVSARRATWRKRDRRHGRQRLSSTRR